MRKLSGICGALLVIASTGLALAQTGGGGTGGNTGGGAGSSAGSTGAPGTAAPGGTAGPAPGTPGAGQSTGEGAGQGTGLSGPSGPANPSAAARPLSPSGAPSPPLAGPENRMPENRTQVRPVPSVGNAEPTSPVNRQDRDAATGVARPDLSSPDERSPTQDPTLGGSGGAGSGARTGIDPGTDVSGTRASDTIAGEPERVQRQGGAGGRSLDDCMKLWDKGTHMSQAQWKATCQRLGQ